MAAHPPGPGLPRQAPSVKTSTSDSSAIEPVVAGAGNLTVKAQLAEIFAGVLRADQRPSRLVEPVEQPGQQKAQRGTAGQQWQRGAFLGAERPLPVIVVEQLSGLGHIAATIGLEAPRVEADRQIIGKKVSAGKIEVDQARELAVTKEGVVGKEIGVDDPGGEIARPHAFEQPKVDGQLRRQAGLDLVSAATTGFEETTPAGDRKIVPASHRKRGARLRQPAERATNGGAVVRLNSPR